jgi:hypothetical protein
MDMPDANSPPNASRGVCLPAGGPSVHDVQYGSSSSAMPYDTNPTGLLWIRKRLQMRIDFGLLVAMILLPFTASASGNAAPTVEQWGVFETTLRGPSSGNPFVDVQLAADFTNDKTTLHVGGFYDGNGTYRIRFSPDQAGQWHFNTSSNIPALSGVTGVLTCIPPATGNHGPVRVRYERHFAYADGTPFVDIGTTVYGWIYQPEAVQQQTLATLRSSPFNKVRTLILPSRKSAGPYPYQRDANGKFDPTRFDPDFFHLLETRIAQLSEAGIQADLILFHPYHKWDMAWFDDLDNAADEQYLRYVVARLAVYRNVWWSLANEYGQVKHKTDADWDLFFQVVAAEDPYGRLRSIHNSAKLYDWNKPWVTHACIQNGLAVADFGRAVLYRDLIYKPLIYDEVCYEGDAKVRWGNLTGQEMVKRFWLGTIAGTYVGHGETFTQPDGLAWTGSGGKLMGSSPPRLAFLRNILEAGPPEGIEPIDETYETQFGGRAGKYYLVYFGDKTPTQWTFQLPRDPPNKKALSGGMTFKADVLDTWNMTITPVPGTFTLQETKDSPYHAVGDASIALPGKPFMAIRIQVVHP